MLVWVLLFWLLVLTLYGRLLLIIIGVIILSESFVQVHLLLGAVSWFLLTFYTVLLLLVVQSFLSVLQASPFALFLADVALDAEHQQNFLSEFVVEIDILLCCDYLVWNTHALKNLEKSIIDFSWEIESFAQILLSGVDFLFLFHGLFFMHFLELKDFFRWLIKFESSFEVDLFPLFFFDKLNKRRYTIYSLLISARSDFSRSVSTLFLIRYF